MPVRSHYRPFAANFTSSFRPAIFVAAAATIVATGTKAMAQVPYFNDFNAGTPGPEWSNPTTETSPSGERFLGQFGAGTVTLNLGVQPAATYTLAFDFYALHTLDGNGFSPEAPGPDNFQFTYDGSVNLFSTNFDLWGHGNTQAYPNQIAPFGPGGMFPAGTGAVAIESLGYKYGEPPTGPLLDDSTYHFAFNLTHAGGPLTFQFISRQDQVVGDEGWGIDNVSVAVPAPVSAALFSLGALLAARRRRV